MEIVVGDVVEDVVGDVPAPAKENVESPVKAVVCMSATVHVNLPAKVLMPNEASGKHHRCFFRVD